MKLTKTEQTSNDRERFGLGEDASREERDPYGGDGGTAERRVGGEPAEAERVGGADDVQVFEKRDDCSRAGLDDLESRLPGEG